VSRRPIALLTLSTGVCLAPVAPPAPAPLEVGAYFPVRVGDRPVYETPERNGVVEEDTEVVTKVEQKVGARVVTLRVTSRRNTGDPPSSGESVYLVSDAGVFRLSGWGLED
jgi:hypothetical protein